MTEKTPSAALIKAARYELKKRAARQALSSFILFTYPQYLMGWVHEEICEALDKFLEDVREKRSPRLIITMPPRSGKLCADETPVLTTKGWKTHGELAVGDEVFSPSGRPVRVIAVGPKNFATHEVEISTGEKFAVHLDHEWTIYSRPQARYKTVETRFFVEPSRKTGTVRKLSTGLIGKRGGRYLYQIDRHKPLQFDAVAHVLPPYCLGVWLGDGTTVAPRINMCSSDAEIVKDVFEELGVPVTGEWVHSITGVVTFSFASGIPNRRNKFSADMKRLNLFDGKYIPDEYKFDSEQNLRELLAGLIDTDGTRDGNRYVFSTVSERLAQDVAEVVRLIGETPHIRKNEPVTSTSGIIGGKPVYTVDFFASKPIPCRLKRKQITHVREERRHAIVSVRRLETPRQGNCIQVDSDDGLYLVGKTLVATHNSEIVSRRFPAYALGRNPDMQIIATSYGSDLSARFNRDVQRIIDDDPYRAVFPDTTLSGKNVKTTVAGSYIRTSDLFEIVGFKGAYRSTGVGGGITGQGADILIVDDPVKDRASANSATIRESTWDWYTSTAYTRLSPGGGVIVMCTRWHTDDLVGRLIDRDHKGTGDHWTVINYPAIAEEDEPHRKKGEALHPERYPLEALEQIRKAVGARDWEALYQQHPVPDGGGLFKREWIQFWDQLPERFDAACISWDMTFKDSKASDYVVGQVWGRKDGCFYLVDQFRGQWDFVKTLEQFIAASKKYPRITRKLVEDKANGSAIISTLKKKVSGIIPITPKESKEARASAVTTLWEAKNVYLPPPDRFPWVEREFIPELLSFPSGAHDDQIDSLSMALNDLSKHGGLNIDPTNLAYLFGR